MLCARRATIGAAPHFARRSYPVPLVQGAIKSTCRSHTNKLKRTTRKSRRGSCKRLRHVCSLKQREGTVLVDEHEHRFDPASAADASIDGPLSAVKRQRRTVGKGRYLVLLPLREAYEGRDNLHDVRTRLVRSPVRCPKDEARYARDQRVCPLRAPSGEAPYLLRSSTTATATTAR